MKIIIAPDSFKGCLRSHEVCNLLEDGLKVALPEVRIIKVPLADGGEGTVEAVVFSTGGRFEELEVHDPLGRCINAKYGIAGNSSTAVIEMASASGIELLKPEELNPWETTTYGTGELIKAALAKGCRDIIIGIGGSATNDGGAGMAQALGYRLLDANGKLLADGCSGGKLAVVANIDATQVIPELRKCRIRAACDVTNPLCGANGASAIYGPQKGATLEMAKKLDANLAHFAEILQRAGLCADYMQPGDGAAGGLGFGLRTLCAAEMVSGANLLIELTGLKEKLCGADLLITGEGCTDAQTANGKLCAVIAATAGAAGVPAILFSGALKGDLQQLEGLFAGMFSISSGPGVLSEAIAAASKNLYRAGHNLGKLLAAIRR
ncbi:MAG: glycerate kinase [Victivallaceae bacterium]